MVVSESPAATPHSWKGLCHEQCYHFHRARRPRPLDKGLRVPPHHRRNREQVVRLRARRARSLDCLPGPARQVHLRVGRHWVPPVSRPDARAGRRANAGMRRLVDRRRAKDDAGKQSSVANVAVARELKCWCWAVGRMAEEAWRAPRRHSRVISGSPEFDGRWLHLRIFFVRRRIRHARSKTDEPDGPAVATRCTGASCAMGEY